MAENLKTSTLSDGTEIPEVTDATDWNKLTTPGHCWYNNDGAANKDIYGALYNYYASNTSCLFTVLDQELVLPSYMVTDQKALTGGNWSLAKVSVYLCLLPSSTSPLASVLVRGYMASTASFP